MIGKVMKGGSGFKGRVDYVLKKSGHRILDSDGVLTEDKKLITESFTSQAGRNGNVKNPCGHISLSYSVNDKDKFDDKKMVELAREYMREMGIKDTQYLTVRHFDTEHPHVHILYNRVDNEGRVISDSFERYRNGDVCKKLKEKHGLYFGQGKQKVKTGKLKGRDKAKYEMYQALVEALPTVKSWQELKDKLEKDNIQMTFIHKGQTGQIQGVCFQLGKIKLKASEVDRKFSYAKLKTIIEQNILSQAYKEKAEESLYPLKMVIPKKENKKVKPKGRGL